MSQISTIVDQLRLLIKTTLASRSTKELKNPIDILSNDWVALDGGFGLDIATGLNTKRMVGCQLSISRTFNITLTNMVKSIHNDVDSRFTTEKTLLEDHYLLVKELEKNAPLAQYYTKLNYISDSGIVHVDEGKKNFLMIQLQVEIEYFESL
jgi:hypothetical protein